MQSPEMIEEVFRMGTPVKRRPHSVWFPEPIPSCQSIAPLSLLLTLLLNGCSPLTTVKDVQNRPHRWFSTVQLQGTVGDRVPLIGAEVYELKDATGKIWVLTPDRSLKTGAQVKIQGKIQIEEIVINGQTLQEVYIEQQHLIQQ